MIPPRKPFVPYRDPTPQLRGTDGHVLYTMALFGAYVLGLALLAALVG